MVSIMLGKTMALDTRNKMGNAPLESAFAHGHQENWLLMKEAALTPEL
jgi:hypothetical protein